MPLVVEGLGEIDVADVLPGAEQQRVETAQRFSVGGRGVIKGDEGQGCQQGRLGHRARCEGDVEALLFQIQRSVSAQQACTTHY